MSLVQVLQFFSTIYVVYSENNVCSTGKDDAETYCMSVVKTACQKLNEDDSTVINTYNISLIPNKGGVSCNLCLNCTCNRNVPATCTACETITQSTTPTTAVPPGTKIQPTKRPTAISVTNIPPATIESPDTTIPPATNESTNNTVTALSVFIALLILALTAALVYSISMYLYMRSRLQQQSHRIQANNPENNSGVPQIGINPSYNVWTDTNYSSLGPDYETIRPKTESYNLPNQMGASIPHPPVAAPRSHDPTEEEDRKLEPNEEEHDYQVLEARGDLQSHDDHTYFVLEDSESGSQEFHDHSKPQQ